MSTHFHSRREFLPISQHTISMMKPKTRYTTQSSQYATPYTTSSKPLQQVAKIPSQSFHSQNPRSTSVEYKKNKRKHPISQRPNPPHANVQLIMSIAANQGQPQQFTQPTQHNPPSYTRSIDCLYRKKPAESAPPIEWKIQSK